MSCRNNLQIVVLIVYPSFLAFYCVTNGIVNVNFRNHYAHVSTSASVQITLGFQEPHYYHFVETDEATFEKLSKMFAANPF